MDLIDSVQSSYLYNHEFGCRNLNMGASTNMGAKPIGMAVHVLLN